jgi:tetratricopeptide (TPR) repeat protein
MGFINMNPATVRRGQFPLHTSSELAFDDEPIGQLVYGFRGSGPPPADLFANDERTINQLCQIWKSGDLKRAVEQTQQVILNGVRLSLKACDDLLEILDSIYPAYPGAIPEPEATILAEFLPPIWIRAVESENDYLKNRCGVFLGYMYAHRKQYAKTRNVDRNLKKIYLEAGDRASEAGMINDIGFSFYEEKRFREAIPFFKKSAEIFLRMNIPNRHANAKANYYLCCFALDQFDPNPATAEELNRITEILIHVSLFWQKRKAWILRARYAELRGEIAEAIDLTQKAIMVTREKSSIYHDEDLAYLNHLKMKF